MSGGLTTGALLNTLRQGLRALFFRRVRWPGSSGADGVSLLLLMALLGLVIGLDRAFLVMDTPRVPGTRFVFDWLAFRMLLGEVALLSVVAWMAFRQAPAHFLNVVFALNLWHVLLSYAVWFVVKDRLSALTSSALLAGFYLWLALATWLLMRRGYGGLRMRLMPSLLLMTPLLIWWGLAHLKPGPQLWSVRTPPVFQESMGREEVFELQRDLLGKKLEALLPQRPDLAEYYFISFAPDGGEAVFRRELDVIQPLVDRRLETEGRSLRLQNSPEGLRQHPVATVSNLKRAIDGVARVMDRDKDVLMLYLTAHGSQAHFLSAELSPLSLVNLTGARLRAMLDEAGIRHRVIVISACYSGGFIDSLANQDTLVITASDATHPSFGCGNESDFTYFGRAFFMHGLSKTVSPVEAYRLAVPVVRQWETELNQGYSNPQVRQGADSLNTLKALTERLSERDKLH